MGKSTALKVALMLAVSAFLSCNTNKNALKANGHDDRGFVRVSEKTPVYFELTDGTPFIPIGPNIAFTRFTEDEKEVFAIMERRFKALSENGGNFARIWISHPFFEIEEQPGVFNEVKARRIDSLLNLAKKYNLRLKLTLNHFRTLDESPPKFAGSVAMGKKAYAKTAGGPFTDITEFFTTDTGRALFLKKLDFFAQRYGSHPSVFGWELWNEIDAVKGTGWQGWTEVMLGELKKRFPKNLVMQSLGSFDERAKAGFYKTITGYPANEVAQIHRYLDGGADLETSKGPMDILASSAIMELQAFNLNKPVLLAEAGAVEPKHAAPWSLYGRDTAGSVLHDVLFAPFFSGSAGTGHVWHWDFYLEKNNLWHHYARFAESIKGLNPVEEDFVPIVLHNQQLRVYGLKGKTTFTAWCRDARSDWHTEFVEGKTPQVVSGAIVDLPSEVSFGKDSLVSVYDPWKAEWRTVRIKENKIHLPDFSRSVIIRITN